MCYGYSMSLDLNIMDARPVANPRSRMYSKACLSKLEAASISNMITHLDAGTYGGVEELKFIEKEMPRKAIPDCEKLKP